MKNVGSHAKSRGKVTRRGVVADCAAQALEQPGSRRRDVFEEDLAARGNTAGCGGFRQNLPKMAVALNNTWDVMCGCSLQQGEDSRAEDGVENRAAPSAPLLLERRAIRRLERGRPTRFMRREAQLDQPPPCGDFPRRPVLSR